MIIYQTTITYIGEEALEEPNLIVLFLDTAPEDLKPYCVLHDGCVMSGNLQIGNTLSIGANQYQITDIGDVAEKNLQELGHVSLFFNKKNVENPGDICLNIDFNNDIKIGDKIIITQ